MATRQSSGDVMPQILTTCGRLKSCSCCFEEDEEEEDEEEEEEEEEAATTKRFFFFVVVVVPSSFPSSLLFTPPLLLLPENEEEEEEEEEREEERREAKVVEVEAKVGGERREQLAHVFMSLLSFKFFNLTSTLFSRVERLFFSFLFNLGF